MKQMPSMLKSQQCDWQVHHKIYMNIQCIGVAKAILKNNILDRIIYKDKLIEAVWHWPK